MNERQPGRATISLPRLHTIALSAAALGLAAGSAQFVPVSAASDKRTLPGLIFPTACLVMTSSDFGTANLTVTVNADASVGNVVVDTSSGKPELDEAFRMALAKSRAVPGMLNGQPQPMPISVKMEATVAQLGNIQINRLPDGIVVTGSRNIYGHAVTVTVTRGSQPRVAQYTCYGNDPHPFDPRQLAR